MLYKIDPFMKNVIKPMVVTFERDCFIGGAEARQRKKYIINNYGLYER